MKKILMGILCLGALVFASCGGDTSTPEGVAKTFTEAMMEGDADKAVSLMYFGDEVTQEQKDGMASMLKLGFSQEGALDEMKGTTIEVVDKAEIAEDGNTAKVTLRATKDGKSEDQKVDLKKDKDGNWKVDFKK